MKKIYFHSLYLIWPYIHMEMLFTPRQKFFETWLEKINEQAYRLIWLHHCGFVNFYDNTIKINNDMVAHLWNTNIV